MITAVIDLGTNTFNLIIAKVFENHFESLYTDKEGVSIGMGGIHKNEIAPEAFERSLACLSRFKAKCNEYKVDNIVAIGTSMLRNAINANDFILETAIHTGIDIQVIDGNREAELIYDGVLWSYDFSEDAVIMDIGGGSTEFIFANKDGIKEKVSFEIGVLRMFQELKLSDPLNEADIETIKSWLNEKSKGYFDDKNESILIGASGTFETFFELIYDKPFVESTEAIEINMEDLKRVLYQLIYSTSEERESNERIIPIRKLMAPITAVKVQWILEKFNTQRVLISSFSLKEGMLRN